MTDPEVAAARAACQEILAEESLAAATGQTVTLLSAAPEIHPGMPPTTLCSYRIADGTVVSLTSQWEETVGRGRSAASAGWGPRVRGTAVAGLPAPAFSAVFEEGRRGLAWTPVIGPALTQVVDVEAWRADGTAADLPFLTSVARATVAQGTVSLPVDPACERLLPGRSVSVQSFVPGRNALVCGYELGSGTAVLLRTGLHAGNKAIQCCQRVDALGRTGRARQIGSRGDRSWRLDWVIKPGRSALTGTLQNAASARQHIGRAGLILLAQRIMKEATRHERSSGRRRR